MTTNTAIISQNPQPSRATQQAVDDIIRKHSLLASGAGLIPVLGLDVAATTAVQVRMVKQMAQAFDLPFNNRHQRTLLTALAGSVVSRLAAFAVREFTGSFSAFGSLAEEMTNAAVAGFFTAAMGEIYKNHFFRGGTLDDLELTDFVDHLKMQIEAGKLHPKQFAGVQSAFSFLT